jgi:NAD(P)-dependent dehydrogenase (short-subunit alcohol dehydrogenase family)
VLGPGPQVGIKDRFAYGMTKGAVLTMTYSIATDYMTRGIRCNCVAPTRIHTPVRALPGCLCALRVFHGD